MGGTQPVIARGVSPGRFAELQRGFGLLRRCRSGEPGQHIAYMLGADAAAGRGTFEHQFHRHQHGLQAGLGHCGQHLGHDAVPAGVAQERLAQTQQGRGQVQKRRAVSQGAGLSLHQINVVLPVIRGLAGASQPGVTGHQHIIGGHAHPVRVQPGADQAAGPFARDGIPIARHGHQAGAAHPSRFLHVAVKRRRHRHQVPFLQFQHLRHRKVFVNRVLRVCPDGAATLAQPGIELGEGAKAACPGLNPDTPAAVLHVLLHHAFLPAESDVAEVRVKQVVAAHGGKAGVDDAPLALLDLVHRRLHVVVDSAPGDSAERLERARVGVEQHLVALAGVGHQPESAAGAQLQMRHLQLVEHPAHQQPFIAPVKLEGFPQLEAQGDKCLGDGFARQLAPGAGEVGHGAVPAPVALCLDLYKQRLGRAPAVLGSMGIGQEGLRQRFFKGAEFAFAACSAVFGCLAAWRLEPLLDRIARQSGELCNGAVGKFVTQFHAPDLAYHVHGDHLLLLLKNSAGQWNTLVNFESALRLLGGQLSVGANNALEGFKADQPQKTTG